MSWLFSQALAEEYSAENSLDGEPYAQLNVMPTPQALWRKDKMIDFSNHSLFGLTSQHLTELRGEELLMWYRVDFLAKIFHAPEMELELLESVPAYGRKWHELLAKFDPDTHLWKTAHLSLLEDLELFLGTWPRWSSMRNGECYQQPMLVRPILERECGFVPNGETFFHTMNTSGMDGGSNSRKALKKRMWITPSADDCSERQPSENIAITKSGIPRHVAANGVQSQMRLSQAVKLWPTLGSNTGTGGATGLAGGSGNRKKLYAMLGEEEVKKMGCQSLNPNWAEWLMGWPMQWTDLRQSETGKSLSVLQQHSPYCEKD
jgi:hypothetical protein